MLELDVSIPPNNRPAHGIPDGTADVAPVKVGRKNPRGLDADPGNPTMTRFGVSMAVTAVESFDLTSEPVGSRPRLV